MKRFLWSVPVKIIAGPRKNLDEARAAVNAVYYFLSGFLGPSDYDPVVEDEIAKEDAPWDLCVLTFKNDRGPSALQGIQSLCRNHDLSVSSDVQSVQVFIKDAFAALDSRGDVAE